MAEEKESFVFYKEYKEGIDSLENNKKKLQFYEIITEYVFYNNIPNNTDRDVIAMFRLIKDKLDKANKSYWNYEARRSSLYKKWKKEVLKRDNATCRICGCKEDIVVHHIEPFSENVSLRYDVGNGITLCNKCHQEVHKNER